MSSVDTPYIVGVVREWEKGFLEEDEFTRLIEAKSNSDAVGVLLETPYGRWLEEKRDLKAAFKALESHLVEIKSWLVEVLADGRLKDFIFSRYDGLNIATAILEKSEGIEEMGEKSPLGIIKEDVIQSVVWNNLGWDIIPATWKTFIAKNNKKDINKYDLLKKTAEQVHIVMAESSFTPLMKEVTGLEIRRLEKDKEMRPYELDDAALYDKEHDENLLATIRKYRFEPIGYDPIISFWYAKEIEINNLRILLSAKLNGLSTEALRGYQRSMYRELV